MIMALRFIVYRVDPLPAKEREIMNWYLEVLKKYAVFSGRAGRSEYWMFLLFNIMITFVIGLIEGFVGSPGIVSLLYGLAVLVPAIGVSVRRLHDTNRSGWWLLISFVPFIGTIVLLVFMTLESQYGDNRFGPNTVT
jgi:uncharacterized membrane protein YhaH (DUF805 family)